MNDNSNSNFNIYFDKIKLFYKLESLEITGYINIKNFNNISNKILKILFKILIIFLIKY